MNQNWGNILASDDVIEAYSNFISVIKNIYDTAFPFTKVREKKHSYTKPWMTKGLVNSYKKKNMLYKKFIIN